MKQRSWSEQHDFLERHAKHWDRAGRPGRLLLARTELSAANRWLATEHGRNRVTALQRRFLAASARHQRKRFSILLIGLGFLTIALAVSLFRQPAPPKTELPDSGKTPPRIPTFSGNGPLSETPKEDIPTQEVYHTVIPGETLESIATRYGASRWDLCTRNLIPCDDSRLPLGTELKVRAKKVPLPQQKFAYTLEPWEDSWEELSRRFGTSVDLLRLYNPNVDELTAGTQITVWADPQISRRTSAANPPVVHIQPGAISHGSPNHGSLENGIRLPESRDYVRRNLSLLFGSSHTLDVLTDAVARFRHEYHFDGVLVLSDMSRKTGGYLPPHRSHQSGRDIDIWLPTIKGAYKDIYRRDDRKPKPEEVHWLAAWALAKSLIDTGEVLYIFLNYNVQEKLFQAAVQLEATKEERNLIQWVPGRNLDERRSHGIIRHAFGHTGHMHVRFKCSRQERRGDCRGIVRGTDDDQDGE